MAQRMQSAETWDERLSEALAYCKVFVPLYSPRYFLSRQCGREWSVFSSRVSRHQSAVDTITVSGIVPALWVPVPFQQLPAPAEQLQFNHADFGEEYADEGLHGLIKLSYFRDAYERAVYGLAKRIVSVAEQTQLAVGDPYQDYREVPAAFGEPSGPSRGYEVSPGFRRDRALPGERSRSGPAPFGVSSAEGTVPPTPVMESGHPPGSAGASDGDVIQRIAKVAAQLRDHTAPEVDDAAEAVSREIADMYLRIGPPPPRRRPGEIAIRGRAARTSKRVAGLPYRQRTWPGAVGMAEQEVPPGTSELEFAHKIAREWADVPSDQLVAVLDAMERRLKREHQLRAKQDERRHALDLARLKEAERHHELELAKLQERRDRMDKAHKQHLVGVVAGMVVSLSCIGGATWFGLTGHYLPMGILVGPVLIALTKMFVLRKSDAGDVGAVATSLNRLISRAPTNPAPAPAPAPLDPGAGETS